VRRSRKFPFFEAALAMIVPVLVGARWLQHRAAVDGKRARVRADFVRLAAAIDEFVRRNGVPPRSLDHLSTRRGGIKAEPVLRALPRDPWGHDYVYEPPVSGHGADWSFGLVSYGLDGAPGGKGEAEDIVFHHDPGKVVARTYAAKLERVIADFERLGVAVERYRTRFGCWPPRLEDAELATGSGIGTILEDPWGNPYAYSPPLEPAPAVDPHPGPSSPARHGSGLQVMGFTSGTLLAPASWTPYLFTSWGDDGAPGGDACSTDLHSNALPALREILARMQELASKPDLDERSSSP
jgi:general secretion pathway protein G